ncbi:VCBS repeat-containing protein [Odoribacter sp. OttesenSCG-928-J03]|nr:VCBS repeat-containing protein [Odoribacter sp. OttesenSCG-928-J03]MDL2283143.1 VCBS repeat-containing protein [Odoribacter sp. OttesenSCG-928-G04]MDL2330499.1 VCBS repeat-containing protein [Odoribacter sp. OttesenSCG-928-A06]
MKKSLFLFIIAAILISVVVYGVWYINRQGEFADNTREMFVPDNSGMVIHLSSKASLAPKVRAALQSEIDEFNNSLIRKSVDTLHSAGIKSSSPQTWAMRVEGRSQLTSLYILENRSMTHRNELNTFYKNLFTQAQHNERRYDKYKIYELKINKESVYYAVEEGMVLISNSELYVEDALKQFERNEEKSNLKTAGKYFSAGAGIHIFMSKDFFSEMLPLYIQTKGVNKNLDITRCFNWAAFDGEITAGGFLLNGFMRYDEQSTSYMKTLKSQKPKEMILDKIIPTSATSFISLNLSDVKAYLTDLDNYRYSVGLIEKCRKRKQEYKQLLGNEVETELKELLQGEFALVNTSFNEGRAEHEGAVVAYLKSGSLCKAWLEKALEKHARSKNTHPDSYKRTHKVDNEKSITYYTFPTEDFAALYWGYIFGNIKNRYAFIVDNYLILASSESVIAEVAKTYTHNYSLKDIEWYKSIRTKTSSKYNLGYFANVPRELPYYGTITKRDLKKIFTKSEEVAASFSTFAAQWSNETDMLYSIIHLGTESIDLKEKPHLLWQTKLDARMGMKPVTVTNHITGEREFLVQDDNQSLYLINNSGRILWKQQLEGKINSDVTQVDIYKNGKLQYLFSTPYKIYLMDRNGEHVGKYPIAFRSECTQGITVYDYDKKKEYRIFAPCVDKEVYLYDMEGQLVKGWKTERSDKEIVSKVYFYRIENKDYIVYADRYRLYIRDRKGKERVRVSAVFDLPDRTEFYLTNKNGKPVIAFQGVNNVVNLVDFSGALQTFPCHELAYGSYLNVADVDKDGRDDFIVTSGGSLLIYDQNGKQTYSKDLGAQSLGFPYVYRFSGNDVRVGVLDAGRNKMLLLNLKTGISKGFPINGESPFSIIFGQAGDFFLFAGADGGHFIKYRVQR